MQNKERLVIGIGDIHGHVAALNTILKSLNGRYSIFKGSNSQLREGIEIVALGDYIDRGSSSMPTIETYRNLKEKNPEHMHLLLGNHEIISLESLPCLKSLLSYPEKMIRSEYRQSSHGSNGGLRFIEEFDPDLRRSAKTYSNRMSEDGDIGSWIRSLEPLHISQINGKQILFAHGGVCNDLQTRESLDKFRRSFSLKKTGSDGHQSPSDWLSWSAKQESLFWSRRILSTSKPELEGILSKLAVDLVVFGHTPVSGITSYFDRAVNVDVGMTPVYGENEPAALVIKPEEVVAFYAFRGEKPLFRF